MPAPQLPEGSMEQIQFAKGKILFEQDQRATHVFVLRSGIVRLMRRVYRESFAVEELGKGAVCGEVALADSALYPVRAEVIEDAVVMAIPAEQFEDAIQREPAIAAMIARKMAARLTYAHYRMASFALRSAEARVLLQLRNEAARAGGLTGIAWVDLPWDLPQALNLDATAVRAELDRLVASGLIEADGGARFRILNYRSFERRLAFLELRDQFE